LAAKTVAITGCGPIGLFAIAVARACGAAQVFAIEVNEYRRNIARQMKADLVLDPATQDVRRIVGEHTNGYGVDVLLEMAGHRDAVKLGFDLLRNGGRVSLLGIPARPFEVDLAHDIIFKGVTVLGINGRKMFETWYQMTALLKGGKLDLHPTITGRLPIADFSKGIELLNSRMASKILLYPDGVDGAF
jgi:threonine 3-dehydrogenase